ncbi:hypothetical protein CMK11_15560 [Candidatus Poribacteria bacterium]|nr:hypothetical protein [Candidatus Poribacteria bacterium]
MADACGRAEHDRLPVPSADLQVAVVALREGVGEDRPSHVGDAQVHAVEPLQHSVREWAADSLAVAHVHERELSGTRTHHYQRRIERVEHVESQ